MNKTFRNAAAALLLALAYAGGALAQMACEPAPYGRGTPYYVGKIDAGEYYFWWCKNAAGQWLTQFIYKRSTYAVKHPEVSGRTQRQLVMDYYQLNATAGSPEDRALFAAAVKADPNFSLKRPKDDEMAVARNSTYPTRPTYLLAPAGGRRADTTRDGSAPVGSDCWCNHPLYRSIEGSNVYCPFIFYDGAASLPSPGQVEVTLCRPLTTSE